jgi:hypothetical protein
MVQGEKGTMLSILLVRKNTYEFNVCLVLVLFSPFSKLDPKLGSLCQSTDARYTLIPNKGYINDICHSQV